MKKTLILFTVFLLSLATAQSQGNEPDSKFKPEIHLKGLSQFYFSYAESKQPLEDPYGFAMRRLRVIPYGKFSENINWGCQLAYDRMQFKLLDIYFDFKVNEGLRFKVGQFAPPGAKSGALSDELFSTSKMALIERAPITQKWLSNAGLYAYRSFGLQVHGKLLGEKLYYGLMGANGQSNGIFTPSVKMTTYEHGNNGLTFWGRLEYKPLAGVGFGGFFGLGEVTVEEVKQTRNSFGGHVFWRKNNLTVLTEFITGAHGPKNDAAQYCGLFFDVAYRVKKMEPAFRFDFTNPNMGGADSYEVVHYQNCTIGFNYYFNQSVKVQANYVIKDERLIDGGRGFRNNLFYINLQYMFVGA